MLLRLSPTSPTSTSVNVSLCAGRAVVFAGGKPASAADAMGTPRWAVSTSANASTADPHLPPPPTDRARVHPSGCSMIVVVIGAPAEIVRVTGVLPAISPRRAR